MTYRLKNQRRKGRPIGSFRGGRPDKNRKDEFNINENITTSPVRVIDENGDQLGVITVEEAIEKAYRAGLDLVEISPKASPPVCKILDYGKFKFQQQKKASEARKNQVVVTVKEITIRPGTEEHDYQIKLKNMKKFLEKGNKVKVSLRFRGREIAHKDLAKTMLDRIEVDLKDLAKVDQYPRMEGRLMVMILSPLSSKG